MATLYQPKSWSDIKKIYNAIAQKLPDLLNQLNGESITLIDFIAQMNDASGVIEECIRKCPNFVKHSNQLKYYLDQLNVCFKCMTNQQWLQSQPEWNEDIDDENSSSSGGGNIMNLYSSFKTTLAQMNEVNLNIKLIQTISYTLSHEQNKYYDRTALKQMARELSRKQQLSKQKTKQQSEEEIRNVIQGKNKNKIER